MPYSSEAQRRFFHTPAARKAGINSEQVKEWDHASKGMKLPEKVASTLFGLFKFAATETTGVFGTPIATNTSVKPMKITGPKPPPWPGDYRPDFLDASGYAAQRASQEKMQAGEMLGLPINT